jgi:polyisoprenoid-binding protein YceI
VSVAIPIADVDSGVPALNDRLRDIEFFDIAKFPRATFKSSKVEKGSGPNQLRVIGDLNLHGVIKPIVLDVTINKGDQPTTGSPEIGFEATTLLKRSDFGMGLYAPQVVSDEVRISITSEAVEAKAYAQELKAEAMHSASLAKEAAEKAAAAENAAKKMQ